MQIAKWSNNRADQSCWISLIFEFLLFINLSQNFFVLNSIVLLVFNQEKKHAYILPQQIKKFHITQNIPIFIPVIVLENFISI
jgi:hypothetical protein